MVNIFQRYETSSYIFLLVMVFATLFNVRANAEVTLEAANAVVDSYMAAVIKGKVNTMQALLGEPQLSQKKEVLDSKEYGKFLRNLYKQASYRLVKTGIIDKQSAFVDVEVTYKKNDVSRFRFWLSESSAHPGLKIIKETEIFD